MLKKVGSNALSFFVLLFVSSLLGACGRTAEMGIAVVAGALGLAFSNIDKFASFKGAGFEAVMRDREKMLAIIEKETESEPESNIGASEFRANEHVPNDESKPIIQALLNPKYTWRYQSGLAAEAATSSDKIAEVLNWLEANSLIRSTEGATGKIWALNKAGRDAFRDLK